MGLSGADLGRLSESAQRQILEKLGKAARENKYHNSKTEVVMPNGSVRVFDSQKEARRYRELMAMLRAGAIRDLRLQVQFTLQESYITPEGDRVRAIRYVADFAYERKVHSRCQKDGGCAFEEYEDWHTVVEDTKGVRTDTYKMKKKLMRERFGITVQEV